MAQDFKTFMSLTDSETAVEISSILFAGKIPHHVHDSRKDFNPAFNNSDTGKSILIQVCPSDFSAAQKLIDQQIEFKESEINPEHFLFGFTESELKEVVKNADEWHPLDVKLALHILGQKGIRLSDAEIESMRQMRIKEAAKPEATGNLEVVIGYIAGFLGGAIGWFIAYCLINHKKTIPDGSQVYNYREEDRQHGRKILILSFVSMLVHLTLFVPKTYKPFD